MWLMFAWRKRTENMHKARIQWQNCGQAFSGALDTLEKADSPSSPLADRVTSEWAQH